MNLRGAILISLVVVAAATGVGFFYADHPFRPPNGPAPVIAFGGVGLGVAVCIVIGFTIIAQVRAHRMPRYLAAVLLLLSSGLSILTPIPVMRIAAFATRYHGVEGSFNLFHGEDAQWVMVIAYGFWVTLAVFALLLFCAFTTGRTKLSQQGGST